MNAVELKEGSTIYGEIEDYNWKDKFLVVIDRHEDIEYKRIIHWDNIVSVTIATNLPKTNPDA
jgi:hypothetical protein